MLLMVRWQKRTQGAMRSGRETQLTNMLEEQKAELERLTDG
jgi:hypothetical protein